MGNKICTSLEQSKKLLELGIDVNTADMWYQYIGMSFKDGSEKPIYFPMITRGCESDEDIPAWSLSALLGLMPDIINLNGINYRQQEFKTKTSYCYCYADERFPISFYGQPVDAAFEMIVWLKENGKI